MISSEWQQIPFPSFARLPVALHSLNRKVHSSLFYAAKLLFLWNRAKGISLILRMETPIRVEIRYGNFNKKI